MPPRPFGVVRPHLEQHIDRRVREDEDEGEASETPANITPSDLSRKQGLDDGHWHDRGI